MQRATLLIVVLALMPLSTLTGQEPSHQKSEIIALSLSISGTVLQLEQYPPREKVQDRVAVVVGQRRAGQIPGLLGILPIQCVVDRLDALQLVVPCHTRPPDSWLKQRAQV